MKIDPAIHRILHTDTPASWPDRTFRAKVTKVVSTKEVEIEVGMQRATVRTQIPLEEGATLLLRTIAGKKELQLVQILPKRSDFSFLSSLDIFQTQTILALANFDEKLKRKLIAQLFDRSVQERLLKLHSELSDLLAKIPADSRLALLAEKIRSKKLRADQIRSLLDMHKKEHEEILEALKALAKDLPDRRSADRVMDVVQMLQNYWLLGQMSNAYVGYLPLDWPDLQESRIVIKRLASRPIFLCKIHLGFTDHGRVDVTLVLHRRYLSVVMGIEDESYRETIRQSRHQLKQQLQTMGVVANILVKEYVHEDMQSFLANENFTDVHA